MDEVSTRFNPRADGELYGRCLDCGLAFQTRDLASAHMHETFEARTSGNSGHRVSTTNPTRQQRIESEVEYLIQGAIDDAIDAISSLTYGYRGKLPDATETEITDAISWRYDGFADAWGEYLRENEGKEE